MIVVYTALFGNIDPLWSVARAVPGVRFVCFTDHRRQEVGRWTGNPLRITGTKPAEPALWEQVIVPPTYGPRRTARYYKALPQVHFPDATASIWLDANVRLRIHPQQALAAWLKGDLAIPKHPERDCVYQEIAACLRLHKDAVGTLEHQRAVYVAAGMPEHWGLAETRIVLRKHTPAMADLGAAWWAQLEQYSQRDQIALPFVCWQRGIRWDVIPGRVNGDRHPQVWHTGHAKGVSRG